MAMYQRRILALVGVAVAGMFVHAAAAAGVAWSDGERLVANDAAADDLFGSSVATNGSVVVIGCPGDDDAGAEYGSVYVFRRVGAAWVQDVKLRASDRQQGDRFGAAVAL